MRGAIANGLSVATRNVGDYEDMGVDLINPWENPSRGR